MHYDFIEIGTSDFDTLSQKDSDEIGLAIEPLLFYLNNLPNRVGLTKVNCAISDTDGVAQIYWIEPSDIKKYNLPSWLRGCNSIIKPHPTAVGELTVRDLLSIYKQAECRVLSWDSLIIEHKVESVEYLKIDTEGHDHIILSALAASSFGIFPKKILFENNILTDRADTERVLEKLSNLGYTLVYETPDNILIERSAS